MTEKNKHSFDLYYLDDYRNLEEEGEVKEEILKKYPKGLDLYLDKVDKLPSQLIDQEYDEYHQNS